MLHFWSISGPIWASFFRCFPKRRKFTKTYKNQDMFNDFASQIPLFIDLFFIDFSCFVRNPSWRAFLAPKTPTYTPKVDFGSHLRFPGVPKMTLGATSLKQKGSKWRVLFTGFYRAGRLGADPAPRDPQNHPKDTISSIWD